MLTSSELEYELRQFTGTEHYYSHSINTKIVYTDGVRAFERDAEAYWLVDILATNSRILRQMRVHGFVMATLLVRDDSTALLMATDGEGNSVYECNIESTDCPHGAWKFIMCNNVIMLPNEY